MYEVAVTPLTDIATVPARADAEMRAVPMRVRIFRMILL
jgi:hypothetical protein